MKYNKTRLCIGGMAGFGSAICLAAAIYLFYIIKYTEIGMGVLVVGPLMFSLATIGVNFAILSTAYLITGLTKCDKQKSNLCIGGVTAVTSLANFGLAAYLSAGGGFEMLTPVIGSLVVAGIVLGMFAAVHFTKASNQEKENNGTGSSIISATAKVTNACASEIS